MAAFSVLAQFNRRECAGAQNKPTLTIQNSPQLRGLGVRICEKKPRGTLISHGAL